MAENRFTPGPWDWYTDPINDVKGLGKSMRFLVGADGQGFAHTVGLNAETDVANARLIAAAPELLDALIAVKEVLDFAIGADLVPPSADGPAAMAAAAISKALGEQA